MRMHCSSDQGAAPMSQHSPGRIRSTWSGVRTQLGPGASLALCHGWDQMRHRCPSQLSVRGPKHSHGCACPDAGTPWPEPTQHRPAFAPSQPAQHAQPWHTSPTPPGVPSAALQLRSTQAFPDR